jgi:quercetin dioxygenase-like cupin family protein
MLKITTLGIVMIVMVACGQASRGAGPSIDEAQTAIADCPRVESTDALPPRGCFTVATGSVTAIPGAPLYWHLARYERRTDASAAGSGDDIVVDAHGASWLLRFTSTDEPSGADEHVAVVGPLPLPEAERFDVAVLYSFLDPGAYTAVHSHPGPEAWYVLTGEQCLDTPAGAQYMGTGESGIAPGHTPMRLTITGTEVRRALAVVVHDAAAHWAGPADWVPPASCAETAAPGP